MTDQVRKILDCYRSENPGVLTNLARILNHGRLGGTGRVIILPVAQGFEHGPARSFAPNPPAYDPAYHFQLALLGAHVIKVKMPTAHLELPDARKVYEDQKIPRDTAADRVRHVVQSAFNGRRIVLFSGGPKESDEALFAEARAVRDGGGFGSIIGRNSFQRDKAAALRLLDEMVSIYQE